MGFKGLLFEPFLLWEDLVVLKRLIVHNVHFGRV